MKKTRRILAILMAAVMLITAFSGCKKEPENSDAPEFVYVPTYTKVDFPDEIQWIGRMQLFDGKFVFLCEGQKEIERTNEETGETYTDYTYTQSLWSMNQEGTEVTELVTFGEDNYYDENGSYNEYVYDFIKTDEGFVVITNRNTETYNLPADFNPDTMDKWMYAEYTSEYALYEVGSDGTKSEAKILQNNSEEAEFYPSGFAFSENGTFYAASYDTIKAFDKDLSELFEIRSDGGFNGMFSLNDGRIGVFGWSETGMYIKIVDEAKKALGEEIECPQNMDFPYNGNGVYDFIYRSSGNIGMSGFDIETGESTEIINWIDSDIDSSSVYPERVFIIDDENIIAFEETWNDEGQEYNIINLKKTPYSEVSSKKIITLACVYLNYEVRTKILEFNRTNPEYRISPTVYSQYASGEDYFGLTKLNTEIISGNIPDIFITENLPMDRYAGKGIFEDLTPYIENGIGFENLVEPVFDALRTPEGKLYEIYDQFAVSTFVGHKNAVGTGESITFDELMAAFEKLPEGATVFGDYMTKQDAFGNLFNNNMSSFVDWESGKCNFDSEEFINILEFANTFPLEVKMDESYYENYVDPIVEVANGELLLSSMFISEFGYSRLPFYVLGDNISFVGQPSDSGNGSSFVLNYGYAMSATCEYKDAAWEFIGQILTEDFQNGNNYGYFPTNKAVFDKRVETAMTPQFDEFYDPSLYGQAAVMPMPEVEPEGEVTAEPEIPEEEPEEGGFTLPEYVKGQVNEKGWHEMPRDWGWFQNGTSYYEFPIYAMTENERDILIGLIERTKTVQRYDESILEIVNEELVYFFNGERSAEQTAEYIQSRVNLYVNEQR